LFVGVLVDLDDESLSLTIIYSFSKLYTIHSSGFTIKQVKNEQIRL